MKPFLIVPLLFALSCNYTNDDYVKSFISGSYFRKVNNEFNSGNDTLIIIQLNENLYRVIKSSSFIKIRNGKTMPLERRSEIWSAIYNKDQQVLHETKRGKVISFFPKKNVLMISNSEFIKIK